MNTTQETLIDDSLDDLIDALETCSQVGHIDLITRTHGWTWSKDRQTLTPRGAEETMRADIGMTRAEVEEMVKKRESQIASRHRDIVLMLQRQTNSDNEGGVAAEFTHKRKNTGQRGVAQKSGSPKISMSDPRVTACLNYIQWKRETLQAYNDNLSSDNFTAGNRLRAVLTELDALFEADLEAWVETVEIMKSNSNEQRVWAIEREQEAKRAMEGHQPTR